MVEKVTIKGIQNLDAHLYRIFPLWFFEDALTVNGGRLVLVRPRVWEDPHEDIFEVMAAREPSGVQKMLVEYLQPTYAQCWSLEGDSDVLMRAYSRVVKDSITSRNMDPRNEGVMVQTTPRKLMQAANSWLEKRPNLSWQFYLIAIEYRDDFPELLAQRLGKIGPKKIGCGDERISSLLFKRTAFKHESEVRLICVADRTTKFENISLEIKPNDAFTNVQFDPRLAPFERIEREGMARSKGYLGPITQNLRYQGALFDVGIPDTCDNLDAL